MTRRERKCSVNIMVKKTVKKSNGNNVFKTVVRGVIREELQVVREEIHEVREEIKNKLRNTQEQLEEKVENTYRKYRDDVLTKMDSLIGEIKTDREEQAAQSMLHEELEERVENLESIHPQGQHSK